MVVELVYVPPAMVRDAWFTLMSTFVMEPIPDSYEQVPRDTDALPGSQ